MKPDLLTYAGFGRRAGALLVDLLVWVAFFAATWALTRESGRTVYGELVPQLLSIPYTIYLHGRFGQTLGKMATGIQVRMLDGSRITWRAAWLRSSVDILFAAVGTAGTIYIFQNVPPDAVHADWDAWNKLTNELTPGWLRYTGYLAVAWGLSELVVMLTNEKRRALHDFIAGTVVVRRDSVRPGL